MDDYDSSEFRTTDADVAWSWLFAALTVFALATVVLPFLM